MACGRVLSRGSARLTPRRPRARSRVGRTLDPIIHRARSLSGSAPVPPKWGLSGSCLGAIEHESGQSSAPIPFAARSATTRASVPRSRSASPRPRTTSCAFLSMRSRTTMWRRARSPGYRSTSGARKICVRNLGDFLPLVMAGLLTTALSAEGGSRVIVSTTLDSTLEIFDADSLAELQSPLPSKGGGPVRLWVQNFDGKDYLFAANHGAVLGSVGVFDLSGEQVMVLTLSPFPARARSTGASPDGTMYDGARGLNYTANIGGDSLSVHDAQSPDALLTVDLPGAGPIDVTLGDSPGGHHWVITSNGSDDSASLIDRDRIAECIYGLPPTCLAPEVVRTPTAVAGGAPEGVAYDAATNRIFV